MTRTYLSMCVLRMCVAALCVVAACSHGLSTSGSRTIRAVEISDVVKPGVIYALPGDEVRWTNARPNAVRVGFLNKRLLDDHRCQKGIVDLFGQVNDLVTIAPGDSISLCFARAGDLRYNVWFDAEDPRGTISPTMTISIRGG